MDDFMKNLSSMLNGKEIPDNIKDMLSSVMNNSNNTTEDSPKTETEKNSSTDSNNDFSNIDINTILKMQQIIKAMNSEQSNSRANLLRSLKPYLKPSRQEKVDQYIQLFNMEKVIELLNNNGGGKS